MRKHSKLIWGIVAVVLMVLTVRTVLRISGGLSLRSMLETLRSCRKPWLVLSLLTMVGFIVFEAQSLLWILNGLGYRRGQSSGLLYAASDVFFSSITPSASGGQPAVAFFMLRDGVSGAALTVTLVVNLIAYTESTMLLGAVGLFIWPQGVAGMESPAQLMILAGFVVLGGLLVLSYLLLHRGGRLLGLGTRLIHFLARIHVLRHEERKVKRLKNLVEQYEQCAAMTKGKWQVLLGACGLTLLQRIAQIFVTVFLSFALYGQTGMSGPVWASTAYSLIGSSFLPLPGGTGAADYLLYQGFSQFLPRDEALQLGLLSRSISAYLCIALSGLISLLGYLAMRKRKGETN